MSAKKLFLALALVSLLKPPAFAGLFHKADKQEALYTRAQYLAYGKTEFERGRQVDVMPMRRFAATANARYSECREEVRQLGYKYEADLAACKAVKK